MKKTPNRTNPKNLRNYMSTRKHPETNKKLKISPKYIQKIKNLQICFSKNQYNLKTVVLFNVRVRLGTHIYVFGVFLILRVPGLSDFGFLRFSGILSPQNSTPYFFGSGRAWSGT
eukprot:TRINITY_DN62103_c0_g1_i1.p3 TRINITY_DN62103_c0_g1~~TRINITY_DN62103_c0_g1_i1.p3  ORF type:complete len:115 (+),score=5.56 TRINITY_DN62103_c0_g1_i1:189-533(+)